MTETQNSAPATPQEVKPSEKELNFRKQEAMYERKLQEREARIAELERLHQQKQQTSQDDEDSYDEPYVDEKRLNKKLNKFGQSTQSDIQKGMELAKKAAKEELKQEMWLESNPDFYDVLQNNAEKFAQKHPKLANTILKMPEGFERQKLVYENIKELGLDRPEQKQSSIQEKVDANKRSPYYQPSGVGTGPFSSSSDFSPNGQKQAYEKMQELKKKLRIG